GDLPRRFFRDAVHRLHCHGIALMADRQLAIVAGAGGALGPALADKLVGAGYYAAGIARGKIDSRFDESHSTDLTDVLAVGKVYDDLVSRHGPPSVLIYNAHKFLIETIEDTSVAEFEAVWRTDVLGAFVAIKHLLPSMLGQGGTILFSGATASVRGSAKFAAFASAKFALRGLSQSLAREYGARGIHVAHVIIDGLVDGGHAQKLFEKPSEDCLAPEAVAEEYLRIISQTRNAWSHEIDLRPHTGKF
ncbi:MAG: SDR family NAD(P)-dependent oxidoreductase, partial [Arenibacterium sp.]